MVGAQTNKPSQARRIDSSLSHSVILSTSTDIFKAISSSNNLKNTLNLYVRSFNGIFYCITYISHVQILGGTKKNFIVSFRLEIEKFLYLKRIAKYNSNGIRNAGRIGNE